MVSLGFYHRHDQNDAPKTLERILQGKRFISYKYGKVELEHLRKVKNNDSEVFITTANKLSNIFMHATCRDFLSLAAKSAKCVGVSDAWTVEKLNKKQTKRIRYCRLGPFQ